MAVAVVFGLAFATLLTLVVVPTFYLLFDDFNALRARLKDRIAGLLPTKSSAHPAE